MVLLDDNTYKLEAIRLNNDGFSFTEIGETLGLSRSAVSRFLKRETYKEWWSTHEKPIAAGALHDHHHKIKSFTNKRYILTSAQNNTFVHSKFLASLEQMASRIDAKIIIGTFSYNLSGFQNLGKGDGEWFDDKIQKYIIDEPVQLAKDLLWCGELNVLPTAVNPLSGFHSYTKSGSGIIPHAKVQMESLPSHMSNSARMLYTTGAVTQRNYIQKKAGQKASFHHIFGALIVEIDDEGDWFVRQLIADTDTGEFYDLDVLYTPTGAICGQSVEGINWGDIHSEKADWGVYASSFGVGTMRSESMIDVLKPKYQFVHDVLDFEARNHHTINDPYVRFQHYKQQKDWVDQNIKTVANVLKTMYRPFTTTVVVESNHDLALQRWLKTSDYRTDPANALFFLDCQYATYQAMANNDKKFSVFEYALKRVEPDLTNVNFLKTDESFMICGIDGIECGSHGDLGLNGSRGSAMAYQKLGSRYNIGHSHSATIKDGVYQAGVSAKMDMGYNRGPSSWSHSHIVTYKNSKRTIITLKNGKWRA
jgi:predicted transcriptional regulator